MKSVRQLLVGLACVALLCVSWVIAVSSKSSERKQTELIDKALILMNDGIYVRAVPLLEEAAGLQTKLTRTAEETLKKAYLQLLGTYGYSKKYTNLLETQMRRDDADADIFLEAADFWLRTSKIQQALSVLKKGIERTGDADLKSLYEKERYAYEMNRYTYDDVTAAYETTIQVFRDGYWGIATVDGAMLIPCEYEKTSTFSADRAVVRRNGEVFAVNRDNNRIEKLSQTCLDFGNLSNDRIPLLFTEGWRRATGGFTLGTAVFEEIGTYSDGFAAAKMGGRWGVIGLDNNWLIPAEYDGIVTDELGRCCAQGAVFVREEGSVYLYKDGRRNETAFDDAKPFSGEGYAAVRRDGKWGYIDTEANIMIGFHFDEARSFGQHLAAVSIDGLWGYISTDGTTVIPPQFPEARDFSCGSAPVKTQRGWRFITLLEYKEGVRI